MKINTHKAFLIYNALRIIEATTKKPAYCYDFFNKTQYDLKFQSGKHQFRLNSRKSKYGEGIQWLKFDWQTNGKVDKWVDINSWCINHD